MVRSRIFYIVLLITAFIFSQALYDSISLFTLVVVLLIPFISLFFLFISLFLVKIEVGKVSSRPTRLKQFYLPIRITSYTPLMLPMMEFILKVSSPEGDRARKGIAAVQYRPFGKTTFEVPLKFDVRGVYQVGAEKVVFYDFLRLFRIKRRIGTPQTVIVEPRTLSTDIKVEVTAQEQESAVTAGGKETRMNGDMAGIREFNENDTLRQVHWKLSSRLSKMIVKTYWENSCDNVMILADLFPYGEDRLQSRHLTDCVVETSLRVLNLLTQERIRSVLGYPNFESDLHQQGITTADELVLAEKDFKMAPMMESGSLEQSLREVDFTSLGGGALYIVTSCTPERAEQAMEPYLKGLNCHLQYLVVRPKEEASRGPNMTVLSMAELEHERYNRKN